ncbi:MAG: glucuronate isomerase [Opitutales bacterium]
MNFFINADFLLQSDVARELYHDYAKGEPIFDYHCHLPPGDIAQNSSFENLHAIWLAGDHYKWRAMRANGEAEAVCTGEASPWEKYLAYARTVPAALRNPLYHWTHLELRNFFGIERLLNEESAKGIWDEANEKLGTPELSVGGILKSNRVSVICTTDDPTDPLEYHQAFRKNNPGGSATRMYPTFRPDKALTVDQPELFNPWVDKLAQVSDIDCNNLESFLRALRQRHDFFHSLGGRLSDHGLEVCYAEECTESEARSVFEKARSGMEANPEETIRFRSYMMLFFGHLDAEKGWTKQLHIGPMRNNNSRLFKALGPDTGFDSIGDRPQAAALSRYLDRLDRTGQLPKTILYNINPGDNYIFASMIGNFQGGGIPGKMQFGSGWWHLDQKEAMEWQMNALSNLGLLSRFVGMLTDSRSFLSFSRHEYFRRILCNLVGRDVVAGELPDDRRLLGNMVRGICFRNAEAYFGLETGPQR